MLGMSQNATLQDATPEFPVFEPFGLGNGMNAEGSIAMLRCKTRPLYPRDPFTLDPFTLNGKSSIGKTR